MPVPIMQRRMEKKKAGFFDKLSGLAGALAPIAAVVPGGQAVGAGLGAVGAAGQVKNILSPAKQEQEPPAQVPINAMQRRMSSLDSQQNDDPIRVLREGQSSIANLPVDDASKGEIFNNFLEAEKKITKKKMGFV